MVRGAEQVLRWLAVVGPAVSRLAAVRLVRAELAVVGMTLAGLLAASTALAAEAPPLAADPVLENRMMQVAEELRCLVCQNETIAASQADLAIDLKKQIRLKLRQGESKAQILDFMVARYGQFVRYRPAFNPTTALLWIGPFGLLLVAGGVLVATIGRHRRATLPSDLSDVERHRLAELIGDRRAHP